MAREILSTIPRLPAPALGKLFRSYRAPIPSCVHRQEDRTAEAIGRLGQPFRVASGDGDARARLCEDLGRRAADAA